MLDGPKTQTTADPPALGCLVRLFWMAVGNFALFLAGLKVSSSERVGVADIVYGGVTLALLLARWIDITQLNGMTIRALPATRAHLRRYSFGLLGVALLGWAAARWLSTLG
jgi:hypothetical protein